MYAIRSYYDLDFADVRTIMKGMGMALLGTGVAGGERRANEVDGRRPERRDVDALPVGRREVV